MAGADRQLDRFEQEKTEFHERVRAAYLARAAEMPTRVRVIDARQSVEQIKKQLEVLLSSV
ncbi:MAG: dTMP kinase, partial [Rhodocyclaceae bacterium]|nr:dTMP kinase [Rhodocyclaceae bacterium]